MEPLLAKETDGIMMMIIMVNEGEERELKEEMEASVMAEKRRWNNRRKDGVRGHLFWEEEVQ